jgi:hypothetical protein
MGLTENRASGPPALNGVDVRPNSVVCVDGAEVGLVASGQRVAVLVPSESRVLSAGIVDELEAASMAREFA